MASSAIHRTQIKWTKMSKSKFKLDLSTYSLNVKAKARGMNHTQRHKLLHIQYEKKKTS